MSKQRIIDLQKQVKIARDAFKRIVDGQYIRPDAYGIAEQALEDMRQYDPKPPSAGLLGWEKRS